MVWVWFCTRRLFGVCPLSKLIGSTPGVPQGSALGPLLFIIYINDLPNSLSLLKAILFADDATVYASSKNLEQLVYCINQELDILADWFKANKLSLNVTKTNFILFTKRRQQYNIRIILDGQEISRKTFVKFLGIVVDHHLNWEEHIRQCKMKVVSALFALRSARKLINEETAKMLYYALVYPHLSYGILLWGSTYKTYIDQLVVLQKRAIRIVADSNWIEHTPPIFKRLDLEVLPIEKYMSCISG